MKELTSLQVIHKMLMEDGDVENIEEYNELPFFLEIKEEIGQIRKLAKSLSNGNLSNIFGGKGDIAADLKRLQGRLFSLVLQNQKYIPDNKLVGDSFFSEFGNSFKELSEKILLLNSIINSAPVENNPITGLSTRESFESKALIMVKLAELNKIHLVMFKIGIEGYDKLKKERSKETINLLNQHYALAINGLIRDGDLLAHYVEGTYNLLVSGISIENARLLAWRISDKLNRNVFRDQNGGIGFFVKTNIGATKMLPTDRDTKEMLDRASTAEKNAKKNGGGYIFFEDIQ